MPSPKRPGTTRILVQVPDDVHAAADTRRRSEGATWAKLISTLLARWASGAADSAVASRVRTPRPTTPDAAETERLHQQWMRDHPAYARACTEPVDGSKLPRYRSLGELLAADARRAGRPVPPEAIAAVDAVVDEAGDV